MPRGRLKPVPVGKGPAPQEEHESVDMTVILEMLRKIKEETTHRFEEMNSRFDQQKKK